MPGRRGHYGCVRGRDHEKLGILDFINRRRRVVSDRTWFGLGFLAMTFGAPGWWKLIPLVLAAALIGSGLNRSLNRTDAETGESRPAPPW